MKPAARRQNPGFPQYMNQLEPKRFIKSFSHYVTVVT
uniref:Uncharacterized protein n=1 Tax=Arundo donax TaxID=35708 RepID=A0A0A9GYB6_ARUDO